MKALAIGFSIVMASSIAQADNAMFSTCAACHGPTGELQALGKSDVINQMTADEVYTALIGYKSGERNTKGMGTIMNQQVGGLSDETLRAVADFIGKKE